MSTQSSPQEAQTLFDAISESAAAGRDGLHFHDIEGIRSLSPAGAVREGERMARWLVSLGISPGDRVGVLGPNTVEWAVSAVAIWRLGATLVPMPYPLIGSVAALREKTLAHCEAVDCRLVLADPDKIAAVPMGMGVAWDGYPDLDETLPPPPDADEVAVIQLSSGSTGQPKGIALSHRSILASIRAAGASHVADTERPVFAGWLPFFHDFGLFRFLAHPLVSGIETHLISLERFAADPVDWWRLVGESRATYTGGAPSAWAITARLAEPHSEELDLSSLVGCSMGAEMVSCEVIDLVQEIGSRCGLPSDALFVAYGLAEATLGVTGVAGDRIRVDEIHAARFTEDEVAIPCAGSTLNRGDIAKKVVSCGRPLQNMEIRIMKDGSPRGEREVGEIQVKSPSLMCGYVGTDQPSPFVGEWLCTGDLGYMADGELYVTGRIKDIIIVFGNNIPAQDLEWAAGSVRGVRPGRCVAFSKPGPADGAAVVLIELARGAEAAKVTKGVKDAIATKVGGFPLEVVIVPRDTIQKTTSGKLRRSTMRDAYAAGSLPSFEAAAVG